MDMAGMATKALTTEDEKVSCSKTKIHFLV